SAAPSPLVVTDPRTSQYEGFGGAAGTSVAETIVMSRTPSDESAATVHCNTAGAVYASPCSVRAANAAMRQKKRGRDACLIFIGFLLHTDLSEESGQVLEAVSRSAL